MATVKEFFRYRKGDLIRLLFALSAGFFSVLTARYNEKLLIAIAFAVTFAAAFCLDRKFGWTDIEKLPKLPFVLVGAAAAGVVLYRYQGFTGEAVPVGDAYIVWKNKALFLLFDVASFPFVAVAFTRAAEFARNKGSEAWKKSGIVDRVLFFCVLAFACVAVGVICSLTNVFYDPQTDSFENPAGDGHAVWFDVLFTTDSGHLLRRDAFWNPSCVQNDIRQPFFALLALPFALVAEVISWIPVPNLFAAVLLVEQIVCVWITGLLAAKLLKLEGAVGHVFALCFFAAAGNFLFAFILEQYAFAVFWLMLAVCASVEKRESGCALTAFAAGGLATSILFAPMATRAYGHGKTFKEGCAALVVDCLKVAGWFLLILCAFGQLTQFAPARLLEAWEEISSFTGDKIGFAEIFFQYTHFVRNLFLAPAMQISMRAEIWEVDGVPSLQLYPAEGVSVTGIVLFVLAVACFVYCRKERFAGICAYWILVSAVILLGVGWGAAENGMILYSMYFVWAFLGLYASAIVKVVRGNRIALVCVFSAAAFFFFVWNGIALAEIIRFGITYYPA